MTVVRNVPKEKICQKCKLMLPADKFYSDLKLVCGLSGRCKVCISDDGKEFRAKNPEITRERNRKHKVYRRYGLTQEQFEALAQFCEVCGKTADLCIDHDHDTGKVRGRLCRKCNSVIGLADDKIDVLMAAIEYLGR